MDNEAIATLPVESAVAEPQTATSQEPQAEPQGPTEVQPTGTGTVEPVVQSPVSQEETRPKPSEFYKQRQKIKSLETQLRETMEMVKAIKSQPASSNGKSEPKNYEKEFYEKPFPTMLEVIDSVLEQKLNKTFAQQDFETKWQTGLNTIRNSEHFKNGGEEATERFQTIIRENGLDEMGKTDPVKAANLAVKLYGLEYGKPKTVEKSPLAPKSKGQMVSTQTGTPSAPKELKMDDYMTELKKMRESLINDPEKRNDPAYKQRVQEIKVKLAEIQKQG